jgi:citronellol/citronellal dehydrogenase
VAGGGTNLGKAAAAELGRSLSGSTITLDGAADDWWGTWPPAALVGERGSVPTEERRGS